MHAIWFPQWGVLVLYVAVPIEVAWSWLFWPRRPVLLCRLSSNLFVWGVLYVCNLCCLCWELLGVWLQSVSVYGSVLVLLVYQVEVVIPVKCVPTALFSLGM
jgi:hypothetical protein